MSVRKKKERKRKREKKGKREQNEPPQFFIGHVWFRCVKVWMREK